MSNFLGGIFKRVGSLISDPIKMTKDTIKNPKKGLKEWSHLYTMNEHKDQDLFHAVGINGWVGKHPQESALAVVGTIFGGWAAFGAGGAAGAAGGATAGAGSLGSAAGAGAGSSLATASGSVFNTGVAGTLGSSAGGSLSMAGAGGSAGFGTAATSSGSVLNAGAGFAGTAGSGSGYLGASGAFAPASAANGTGSMTWQDFARRGQQSQGQEQQQQPQQQLQHNLLNQQMRYRAQDNEGVKVSAQPANQVAPASTSDLIGNNKQYSATDFKNQF